MKTILLLLTLSLACHAQTLRWELSIPVDAGWTVTASPVVPDGTGGGAIVLGLDKLGINDTYQCVWFDGRGAVNVTNDVPTSFGTGSPSGRCNVLRVTPKFLDLEAVIYTQDVPRSTLRRFVRGRGGFETLLQPAADVHESERVASQPAPAPDKRGFFTTQLSATNVVVRRYVF